MESEMTSGNALLLTRIKQAKEQNRGKLVKPASRLSSTVCHRFFVVFKKEFGN